MRKKRAKTATCPDRPRGPQIPLAAFLACLSVFLIISTSSRGRQPPKPKDYALIFGTVWSADDLPVPGVKVKIRRAGEKRTRWEVYSNRRGEFEQRVPVGKQEYIVQADTDGHKSHDSKHLQPGPEMTVKRKD